jgi:hypothetical protein
MRTRKTPQPGYRPLIRSLLIIAGLLGAYAVLQPLRTHGPDQATNLHAPHLPDAGWSRTV